MFGKEESITFSLVRLEMIMKNNIQNIPDFEKKDYKKAVALPVSEGNILKRQDWSNDVKRIIEINKLKGHQTPSSDSSKCPYH